VLLRWEFLGLSRSIFMTVGKLRSRKTSLELLDDSSRARFGELGIFLRVSRDREQGFQRIVSNDFRGS
jgi:hypothetical protein